MRSTLSSRATSDLCACFSMSFLEPSESVERCYRMHDFLGENLHEINKLMTLIRIAN